MNSWLVYALGAAVLYGLHQVFTKLAAARISDGLGGFVVEATAAVTILLYLLALRFEGAWNQSASATGVWYSVLTGVCVGGRGNPVFQGSGVVAAPFGHHSVRCWVIPVKRKMNFIERSTEARIIGSV